MASIYGILASSYQTAALNTSSSKPYVNVDPKLYEGSWEGTLSNGKAFKLSIAQVQGFRAQVSYQSGETKQYQSVLIRDGGFRVGETKFILASNNKAIVKSVITDPVTGQSALYSGQAVRD